MEASPATPPGPPPPPPQQAPDAPLAAGEEDWLRILGGVAFAVGAVVLFIRKSGGAAGGSEWADFPLLLVIGIPCVLLFWLGVSGRSGDQLERWRSVLMVTGVLLAPIAFVQLRDTLGLSAESSFWTFMIFAGTAAMAAYASFVVGAAYQALLAALAGIAAWLSLWDWILSDPGINTFRVLLILLLVAYVGWAVMLRGAGAQQAPEIVTAAGIVAVSLGVIGVIEAGLEAIVGARFGGLPDGGEGQSFFWDLWLLVVSLALVAFGAVARARGPAYVGFLGLVGFALLVGVEVTPLIEGERPDGKLIGWPLILLLLGGGALAAGAAGMRQGPR
jgi:hypothetical protein